MMATSESRLFDSGLQPERTALAWRRTALSVAAGSLVLLRLSIGLSDPLMVIPALTGLVAATGMFLCAEMRYGRHHRVAPPSLPHPPQADGVLPTTAAAAVLLLGVTVLLEMLGLPSTNGAAGLLTPLG